MYIMALQVWLPLNGNLNNQGLAGSVTVTNHGAAVNSSGKIGSCYSFTTSQYMELNNVPFSNLNAASVCFWVKIPEEDGSWLPFTGQSTSYYILATSRGTGNFYHQNAGSGTIYCDGVLRSSPINDGKWHHYCITNVNLSTWTKFYINYYGSTGSGWNFNGQMNDIRIYDHCLSPKEVHSISQALILHYKLDEIGGINENLLPASSQRLSVNGSTSSNEYMNLCDPLSVYETYGLVPYTVSFDIKAAVSHSFLLYGSPGSNFKYNFTSKYINVTTEWTRVSYTFTPYLANETGTWASISVYGTYGSGAIVSVRNVKLEVGSSETSISPTIINKIYDDSGYQNNGSITGTLQLVDSDARYRKCASFNGSSNNIISSINGYNTTYTFVVWAKFNKFSVHLLDCRNSNEVGYQPMYVSNGGVQVGGSATGFPTINYSFSTNTWYHIAVIYSTNKCILYVNGNKIGEVASGYGYNYETNLTIHLGSRLNNTNWFSGNISDFRIYATALSAEDVKSLYNVGAVIDNGANMHTYEYHEIESTTPKVHRTGVTDSSAIIEPDTITNASFSKTGIIKAKNFYEI